MNESENVDEGSGRWRLPVAAAGLLLVAGGGMHPEAPDDLSFRDNLAAMMEDDAWVPGHTLVAVSAALVLVALVAVRRSGAWPVTPRLLRLATVAAGLNLVEAVLHTASVVDKDQLAAGETPPVTLGHLIAAVIAYPLFGAAIAALAWTLARNWSPPLRAVSGAGIVGGIATAFSAPLVVVARVQEFDLLFAVGAIGIALWLTVLGLAGLRATAPAPQVAPA